MRTLAVLTLVVYLAPGCYAEDWDTVHGKGVAAVKRGDFETAVILLGQSVQLADTETRRAVSDNDLGIALGQVGNNAESKIWLELALNAWKAEPSKGLLFAQTASALAGVDRKLGNYQAAEEVLRAGLEQQAAQGGTRSYLLSSLGDIMREEGNFAESRRLLEQAAKVPGVWWRQELDVKVSIAELDRDTRNWNASENEWNEAATLAREQGDAGAEATCERGLGQTWLDQGNTARAEPLLKAALVGFESRHPRDESEIANVLAALGEMYLAEDKSALAEDALRRSLASEEQSLGATHPQTALVLQLLADSLSRQHEVEMARGYLDRAEKIMAAQFGEHSLMAATVFANRGLVEQRAGYSEVAVAQYRKALASLNSPSPDLAVYRHLIMTRYAAALKASHHKHEADAILAQAQSFRSK